MAEVNNLMEGLLDEMNRVRELITEYESLPNNAGVFGATLMKANIKKAEQAIKDDNVIDIMYMYQTLKNHE